MDLPIVLYDRDEYIETDTRNKISRKSIISGPANIVLGGKTIVQSDCFIRGDLRRTVGVPGAGAGGGSVAVALGRYCVLERGCVIRPPFKTYKGVFSYYPVKIGDFVHIGSNSVVEAASIGNGVRIGKNVVVGRFAIIKDFVRILDGTVIPANAVIPSFSLYGGNPGTFIEELPESVPELFEASSKEYYEKFLPAS
ncbi:dynactin, subunit p25 [Gonapodya prolifera JEL478]|uniref:Dynactin subunit 5 n=1 Tax=Gonapodya prolifera (strain JEL478) TaxID=1344416 RepID=A0A139AIE5_GONPJ|nr:dynactin, subunit p25 [Gonapodya prolifera JEL478]|eukprot:KXS16314.1 dynactin, subunit p25 [Gonapodya prolifera JEL478]